MWTFSNKFVSKLRKPVSNFMYRIHSAAMSHHYEAVERGSPYSLDYRVFLRSNGKIISPWHDIPLYADEPQKVFNMICEIPRWTNAKMEIATKEALNPIKQDVKNNKLRFVDNCFPHHGYIWNYGALPQTWEDPAHIDPHTEAKGDNDPIDVCEIGSKVAKRGEVLRVKVLGVLGLLDEGETDWKLITIDVNDPLAAKLNDIKDVESVMPGLLRASLEWFKIYKIPAGKPANKFAFDGEFKDREFALKVINETHEFWRHLVAKEDTKGLDCHSVTVTDGNRQMTPEEASAVVESKPAQGPAHAIDPSVDRWHFIKDVQG